MEPACPVSVLSFFPKAAPSFKFTLAAADSSLSAKGEGKVLNRDEVIECVHQGSNMWLTIDYKIEAELQ